MFAELPSKMTALIVSLYWVTVVVKVALITPRLGKLPNVFPRDTSALLSRLVMLPLIIFWVVYPWQIVKWEVFAIYPLVAWFGALLAIVSLLLSFYCWAFMGKNWRIGIDKKETTELLVDGPFKFSRHPIYTLSILLMLATLLTYQSIIALGLLLIHWGLFTFEAMREERYMNKTHPGSYQVYCQSVGRFFPKV